MNLLETRQRINAAIDGATACTTLAESAIDEDVRIMARHAANMYIDTMLALVEIHKLRFPNMYSGLNDPELLSPFVQHQPNH